MFFVYILKIKQFLFFPVNLISLSQGTAVGWTSPFLPILQSKETPLESGPVSNEETSWIGATLCIGAIIGTFLFGWMADKFGRKISACTVALPQMVIIFKETLTFNQ